MARKAGRLWTAFLGGGSMLLGVGITHFGLKYHGDRQFFDNCLCEPQSTQTNFTTNVHVLKKQTENQDADAASFDHNKLDKEALLEEARTLMKRFKEESGSPGLAVSVSVDGQTVWSEGFGYSDIENDVPCTPNTVMRIASISKPLTATATMKLLDEGKLNLDDSIQKYVPSFPTKEVNSKSCVITIRHLLSHQSGIRHYHAKRNEEENTTTTDTKDGHGQEENKVPEYERKEYYIKECYDSVQKSLSLFKDDPLLHEPGSKYLYTTFGYTLLSAVIESASEKNFLAYMYQLFRDLGMNNTHAELHKSLIYGRARHYMRNKAGQLVNTPYVDNSYKWAGGGFVSTSEDLVKFGNAMLYASQIGAYQGNDKDALLPGIVSPESMRLSWTIVENTRDKHGKGYGLGWGVLEEKREHGCGRHQQRIISHSGGAIGASSILLIQPDSVNKSKPHDVTKDIPSGVVVVMLVNMGNVKLRKPALNIARLFRSEQKD